MGDMGDRGDRGDRGDEKVRGVKSTCLQPRGYRNHLTSKLTFTTDVLYWGVSRTLVVGVWGRNIDNFWSTSSKLSQKWTNALFEHFCNVFELISRIMFQNVGVTLLIPPLGTLMALKSFTRGCMTTGSF